MTQSSQQSMEARGPHRRWRGLTQKPRAPCASLLVHLRTVAYTHAPPSYGRLDAWLAEQRPRPQSSDPVPLPPPPRMASARLSVVFEAPAPVIEAKPQPPPPSSALRAPAPPLPSGAGSYSAIESEPMLVSQAVFERVSRLQRVVLFCLWVCGSLLVAAVAWHFRALHTV